MRHTWLDRYDLSTGQMAQLFKAGRRYGVMVTSNDPLNDPPEITRELTKAGALDLLADIIRDDMMEVN